MRRKSDLMVELQVNRFPGAYRAAVAEEISDEDVIWIDYVAAGESDWESIELPRRYWSAFKRLIAALHYAMEEYEQEGGPDGA